MICSNLCATGLQYHMRGWFKSLVAEHLTLLYRRELVRGRWGVLYVVRVTICHLVFAMDVCTIIVFGLGVLWDLEAKQNHWWWKNGRGCKCSLGISSTPKGECTCLNRGVFIGREVLEMNLKSAVHLWRGCRSSSGRPGGESHGKVGGGGEKKKLPCRTKSNQFCF